MAKDSTFHGWTVRRGKRGDGKPVVELRKPERNTITTIGRKDGDPAVLLERARVYALEQDVEAASGDERKAAEARLREATLERDVARAQRVAAAAVRAAAEGGE